MFIQLCSSINVINPPDRAHLVFRRPVIGGRRRHRKGRLLASLSDFSPDHVPFLPDYRVAAFFQFAFDSFLRRFDRRYFLLLLHDNFFDAVVVALTSNNRVISGSLRTGLASRFHFGGLPRNALVVRIVSTGGTRQHREVTQSFSVLHHRSHPSRSVE